MDQIAFSQDDIDQLRAEKISRFIDNVEPQIDRFIDEVWRVKAYTKAEEEQALIECAKLREKFLRCSAHNYPLPNGEIVEEEQDPKEEAERAIDIFLDEMLSYQWRSPLALFVSPTFFSPLYEFFGMGFLEPYYQLAEELYPRTFERLQAREAARKEAKAR